MTAFFPPRREPPRTLVPSDTAAISASVFLCIRRGYEAVCIERLDSRRVFGGMRDAVFADAERSVELVLAGAAECRARSATTLRSGSSELLRLPSPRA